MPTIGFLAQVGPRLPTLCLSHSNMVRPFGSLTQASPSSPIFPVNHDCVFTYSRHCSGHMWMEKFDIALLSSNLSSKQARVAPRYRELRRTQQEHLSQVWKVEGAFLENMMVRLRFAVEAVRMNLRESMISRMAGYL